MWTGKTDTKMVRVDRKRNFVACGRDVSNHLETVIFWPCNCKRIGALYWIEVLDCGEHRASCLYQGKDSEFGIQIIQVSVGEINASFMKVASNEHSNKLIMVIGPSGVQFGL